MTQAKHLDPTPRTIAVLIDFENLAFRGGHAKPSPKASAVDVKAIMERLADKGRITVRRAYCDWQRYAADVTPLHELGIELIEIPDRASTGKNSADIRLAVDAVEMCLTKSHIDTFAILSGDSDFSPVVAKLREYDKTVIGVGRRESTSNLLVDVCDEFMFYEDIVRPVVEVTDAKGGEGSQAATLPAYRKVVPKGKQGCYKLLLGTIDSMQRDQDGPIQGSALKQAMVRKQPQFSEGTYGYSRFSKLLEEAAHLKLIKIKKAQNGYSVLGFNE